MALALNLTEHGHAPRTIETQARVHLRRVDGIPTIVQIDLETEADVPGLDQTAFQSRAEEAKAGCIISRALGGVEEIRPSARLR